MLNKRADKLELLRIAEAVALEKSIDKELIISSMETGIAKAAKSKFGQDNEIKVIINRDSGDIKIFRKLIVSENPENSNTEIKLKDAIILNEMNKDKSIGDEVLQPLPSFDFGRIAAQTAKQVINFNVREAERERQFNDFIDKKDTILSGIVKRLEFGNVIVDLGRTEAIIQKNEIIPRENIKAGDRIKAYCHDVRREPRGQQIFLSRAHPKFMEKLFVQEVPEIYDGLIEIKSSSRDPGSRAKICVKAIDTSLDPVGACVGMRGSRVQAVVNELQGEKIDIVNWSEDPAVVAANALSPAEVQRVNVDNEAKKLDQLTAKKYLNAMKTLSKGQPVPVLFDLRDVKGTISVEGAQHLARGLNNLEIAVCEVYVVNSFAINLLVRAYKRIYHTEIPYAIFNDISNTSAY